MTIGTQKLTFAEYLAYREDTDTRYELVDGELVAMSLGTGRHGRIIKFVDDALNAEIQQAKLVFRQEFFEGLKTLKKHTLHLSQIWLTHSVKVDRLLDWTAQRLTVGVQSPRGYRWDTCRIPDVTVLTLEQWADMDDREAVILAHQAPPQLVVEVVSQSTETADYRAKWVEYSALDIAEYWIVDPLQNKVTVCVLDQGRYQDTVYQGNDPIASPTFPNLNLSAEQILKADG